MGVKSDPFLAINVGDRAALELALDMGSDVNTEAGTYTLLTKAIALGNAQLVESLLQRGANPHLRTPLVAAAAQDRADMLLLLLAAGSRVNAPDENWNTALHLASGLATVELLLDRGANAEAMNRAGFTPLMNAQAPALAEALITRGAAIDAQNRHGLTALMIFALEGRADLVRTLLAYGADVGKRAADGATAFMYAIEEGHDEVARLLADAGAVEQPGPSDPVPDVGDQGGPYRRSTPPSRHRR